MKHVGIFLTKLLISLFAFSVGFLFFTEATYVDVLTFALLTTILSYIAVDLIILPRFGNRTALVSDFILTYFIVWVFGSVLFANYMLIAWGSILATSIITFCEVFVHNYLLKHMYAQERRRQPRAQFAFNTELAEDEDPTASIKREKD
ncbi:YndM family protein [Shouchella sp. JSM 1781072]|uniref:YndM family protein n=1 Tax=Bacillaceae TaxID=186817 RepID=UPI000C06FC7C|nr:MULTISPECIES: YndM family protein [Bacillaceae]UTR06695.1 YndM family protein [Alkalihalobacillus sp. LMS6]